MKILISESQLKKIVENIKDNPTKRKTLDFFDLVSKGIVFVVEPHENGERVKPNWEHDTNLITLWNLEYPEPGQEWVKKAKHFVKNESIKWWNEVGQFELSDEKYNQILKSIDLYKEKNKKDDTAKFLKCQACKKWFTQTIHKKKKSLPICTWCGKHNTQFNENQEVDERSRSFAFTRKKRLFSKPEMMANPDRYKKHDKELKEIGTYKFSEIPSRKNNDPNDYQELMDENPHLKNVGDFIYLYNIIEDNNTPIVMIYVLDSIKKVKAAVAEFEMRYGDQFFVTLPYVKKEYRNMGIAAEIYKSVLMFGDLVSGKAQSQQAVGLWKKMFKTFPNKMTFIDDKGIEHEIISKDDKLIVADTGEDVHGNEVGGYLKMKRTI